MVNPPDVAFLDQLASRTREYFSHHFFTWATVAEIAVIGGALLIAWRIGEATRAWLTGQQTQYAAHPEACADLARLVETIKVINPFLAFILVGIAYRIAGHFHWPRFELFAVGVILVALTVVRLFTEEMKSRLWAKILIMALWVYAVFLAALGLLDLIGFWFHFLQGVDFQIGHVRFSLLDIQRAFFLLLALYWVSKNLRILLHFWLKTKSGLTPAAQILLHRLGSISLFVICVVIVLHYLGLDLTVFALFSGALGLGLGFGLQRIFANLVSGFILLADKSIKPGDVIQLGDKFGWINFLGTRYTSVISRNGTEHLIPNENLVTSEVINWSYSDNLVRVDIPVGVSYGADLEKARDLVLEAATGVSRVLEAPRPVCLLKGFGDNSVNLELRVWLNDPQNGLGQVRSNLLWGIWQRFHEHGIELPFPQRDLYLKSMPEVKIRTGAKDD